MIALTVAKLFVAKWYAKHKQTVHIVALVIALLAAMCTFFYNRGYDNGYSSADDKWIKSHNTNVKKFNKRVGEIEKTSREEASTLREENAQLKTRLAKMVNAAPTIIVRDAKGEAVKCEGKTIVPYLGSDFTREWNRLNEEGEMK